MVGLSLSDDWWDNRLTQKIFQESDPRIKILLMGFKGQLYVIPYIMSKKKGLKIFLASWPEKQKVYNKSNPKLDHFSRYWWALLLGSLLCSFPWL